MSRTSFKKRGFEEGKAEGYLTDTDGVFYRYLLSHCQVKKSFGLGEDSTPCLNESNLTLIQVREIDENIKQLTMITVRIPNRMNVI